MDEQPSSVRIHAVPELRRPYLVAAWSGMGAVGLLAANYMRQELDAELFGEIDPYDFFSPSQVLVQDGLIQNPEFPESHFYFWDKGKEHDLIIFVGTEQPTDTFGMTVQVLDVAQRFGVERIYTAAAFATIIHHSQEPKVWGTATHPHLVADMRNYGVAIMERGPMVGLNALLLAVAKEHDIEGLCLLGEIPFYATRVINPRASHAVLSILERMLEIEVDLTKLSVWAEDLMPQMDKLYSILPDQAKEVAEDAQATMSSPLSEPLKTEQPLVADERFFEDIEYFLKQHGLSEDDEEEDVDQSSGSS